jgi:hypothetical protein
METETDVNMIKISDKSRNDFLIIRSAFFSVGIILILFSRYVLSDRLPATPSTTVFKSDQLTSINEANLNISRNANALTTTIIGFLFIVVSLLFEFFELFSIFITKQNDYKWQNILMLNCGPTVFMLSILFTLNILHEKETFDRIVNNQVGKNYYLIMQIIPIIITINFLVLLFHWYKDLSITLRSAIQCFLGVLLFVLNIFLYQMVKYFVTQG